MEETYLSTQYFRTPWGGEEVSFQDFNDPFRRTKKGYQKIDMTCRMASAAGLEYAWIDTCCIDKSSSAELTEAINSMYQWYGRAQVCYVFLADLPASAPLDSALPNCRWFGRGWTLQELIAPNKILFFDRDWTNRGSKNELIDQLSKITGISSAILQHTQPLSSLAVAQKMSWAAHRETTRVEDMAYCLLGIFDVNMPLLYGEEDKAFRRLQEEIVKSTADLSVFAWKRQALEPMPNPKPRVFCGLLAASPLAFSGCTLTKVPRRDRHDFSISNRGIRSQIQILSQPVPGQRTYRYVLPLDCYWNPKISLGIRLRKCGPDHFIREDPWSFVQYKAHLWANGATQRYFLTELPGQHPGSDTSPFADMRFFIPQLRSHVLQIKRPSGTGTYDCWPWSRWDDEDGVFFVTDDTTWDSATVRLRTTRTVQNDQGSTSIEFETVLYAIGWSSLDTQGSRGIQCSIIKYQPFASTVKEVHSQIALRDNKTHQVLRELNYHKIPKASAAIFDIPGSNASAVVSFTPRLATDPDICRNKFWRIEVSCEIYEPENFPQIHYGKWTKAYRYA